MLVDNQIKHQKSAPYSPHQNGTIERSWRTLFSMVRCLLNESKLPKNFWINTLVASAYIRNRCYNKNTRKTPHMKVSPVQNQIQIRCLSLVWPAFVMYKIKWNKILAVIKASLSAMISKVQLFIYIFFFIVENFDMFVCVYGICRLLNTKSSFIQIDSCISNNSV